MLFTSLVKFIPRYVIIFDATINQIAYLIFLFDSFLLVYRNTTDFYILILYSAILLQGLLVLILLFNVLLFNVVYHIDWFADIEPSLHLWNKPHLIMVYEPLLDLVC